MTKRICLSWRQLFLLGSAGLAFVVVSAAVSPRPAHAQATLVVDDDGRATATDCNANRRAFSSIQAAVNSAAPGDTILICPGTYNEQVVVTTDGLTIRGAGTGLTVLRPSAVVANTTSLVTPIPVPVAPILLVNGVADVTVEKLTIDGSAADGGAGLFVCGFTPHYVGIKFRNSSGTVDTVHITNMRSATVCGFGFRSESGAGGASDVILTGNLVDHYGDFGMVCAGLNTSCTITGNTVRGQGPVDNQIQGGIAIRAGAVGAISGNVITDHFYLPTGGIAAIAVGIFLVNADPDSNPHLLRDNVFANNELNVQRVSTEEVID